MLMCCLVREERGSSEDYLHRYLDRERIRK